MVEHLVADFTQVIENGELPDKYDNEIVDKLMNEVRAPRNDHHFQSESWYFLKIEDHYYCHKIDNEKENIMIHNVYRTYSFKELVNMIGQLYPDYLFDKLVKTVVELVRY